ncbi:MAG: SCP2 sterol-binding domain-containing protein, partial [Bacteroidota bacterium]
NKKPASDQLFQHIKKYIKEKPEAVRADTGIFQFHITGDKAIYWKLDFNKHPGQVRKGKAANPDVTFTIQENHLMRIAKGSLDIQTAFVQGRLKVKGDMGKAMFMGKFLSKVPKLT